MRIDPSDLLLEVVSIVIAILLALAVNRWQERLGHDQLVRQALSGIRREMIANRAELLARMPLHRRVAHAFVRFGSDGRRTVTFGEIYSLYEGVAPRGFQPFRGNDIAWQTAQRSQAVQYMPYDTLTALATVYDGQAAVLEAENHFVELLISVSGSSRDYQAQAVGATSWLLDVTSDEQDLAGRYDRALALLPT